MSVILDPQAGYGLSAEHQRIAQLINEYDPALELAWVPPDQRAMNEEFPFAVIHRPMGREPYIVFKLRASEVDHRVLPRLFHSDNAQANVLDVIEREEAARKIVDARRQEDEAAEAQEMAAWAVKARAGSQHNGVRYE